MPDNFIYYYQSLIAGVMALVAGGLGFWAALQALEERRKENSARQTNFVASIVVKLKIFGSDTDDLFDAFSHMAERIQEDPSYYPALNGFKNIDLPVVLEKIWEIDVGLPIPIILKIEELIDSAYSAKRKIEEFSELLSAIRRPQRTPQQLEFGNMIDVNANHRELLLQQACAARDFLSEVGNNAENSAKSLIEQFNIDERSVEALWQSKED